MVAVSRGLWPGLRLCAHQNDSLDGWAHPRARQGPPAVSRLPRRILAWPRRGPGTPRRAALALSTAVHGTQGPAGVMAAAKHARCSGGWRGGYRRPQSPPTQSSSLRSAKIRRKGAKQLTALKATTTAPAATAACCCRPREARALRVLCGHGAQGQGHQAFHRAQHGGCLGHPRSAGRVRHRRWVLPAAAGLCRGSLLAAPAPTAGQAGTGQSYACA